MFDEQNRSTPSDFGRGGSIGLVVLMETWIGINLSSTYFPFFRIFASCLVTTSQPSVQAKIQWYPQCAVPMKREDVKNRRNMKNIFYHRHLCSSLMEIAVGRCPVRRVFIAVAERLTF